MQTPKPPWPVWVTRDSLPDWPFRTNQYCQRDRFLSGLSLQALLDLGGSPNYKDRRGLTPLFHTAMVGGDPRCCELLLYNRAQLGIADENGWQEIHQVLQTRPGGVRGVCMGGTWALIGSGAKGIQTLGI